MKTIKKIAKFLDEKELTIFLLGKFELFHFLSDK